VAWEGVIARALASEGAHVTLIHLGHRDEGVTVCREIEAKGGKAFLVHLDQSDPSSCEQHVVLAYQAVPLLRLASSSEDSCGTLPHDSTSLLTP
jgi:NAD(P)-dependent dehydrogenase (short-subunit alcohol dehydrogenase family)